MRAEAPLWTKPASLLALLALVPAIGLVAAGARGGKDAVAGREVIVATGAGGGYAHAPGSRQPLELPLLLPGDTGLAVGPGSERIAFASRRAGSTEVYVATLTTGVVRRLTAGRATDDADPTWSPDGTRLAWTRRTATRSSIVIARADGEGRELVIADGRRNEEPAWEPRGDRIAFVSTRDRVSGLWLARASGASLEPLATFARPVHAPAWSPRGTVLAFEVAGDIWRLDLADGQTRPVVRGPAIDTAPSWSPDGRRLVFERRSDGRTVLATVPVAGGRVRLVPGSAGETTPQWATAAALLVPPVGARLPDLDQRPPTDLAILKLGGRWALGFTSSVENRGNGPLVIHGARQPGAKLMRADQVVELADGRRLLVPRIGRLRYEPHPPHFHWHLQPFESYTLRSVANPNLVVRDRKSGFCLVDRYGNALLPVEKIAPPRFTGNCATGRPGARSVVEGSSPGYRDRYPAFYHGQDVDLTGLPPGLYVLAHQANPLRTARERRYSNDAASVLLRLEWPEGREGKPTVKVLRACETTAVCLP
ncbi:MAG: lysyl oxidase family protein [Gaiellales bacterium]